MPTRIVILMATTLGDPGITIARTTHRFLVHTSAPTPAIATGHAPSPGHIEPRPVRLLRQGGFAPADRESEKCVALRRPITIEEFTTNSPHREVAKPFD